MLMTDVTADKTTTAKMATNAGEVVGTVAWATARFGASAAAVNEPCSTGAGPQVVVLWIAGHPLGVAREAPDLGVADQPYGLRQGRVVDSFGHHWLIGRPL